MGAMGETLELIGNLGRAFFKSECSDCNEVSATKQSICETENPKLSKNASIINLQEKADKKELSGTPCCDCSELNKILEDVSDEDRKDAGKYADKNPDKSRNWHVANAVAAGLGTGALCLQYLALPALASLGIPVWGIVIGGVLMTAGIIEEAKTLKKFILKNEVEKMAEWQKENDAKEKAANSQKKSECVN